MEGRPPILNPDLYDLSAILLGLAASLLKIMVPPYSLLTTWSIAPGRCRRFFWGKVARECTFHFIPFDVYKIATSGLGRQ